MSNVIDAAMIFAVPALIGGSLAYLKMGVMALRVRQLVLKERKRCLKDSQEVVIRVKECGNVVRGDGVIHTQIA